jgi:hypothetical protein
MLPEIAKEWIAKAEEDYGFACAGMECTEYFAQICFHFQQAAGAVLVVKRALGKAVLDEGRRGACPRAEL